MKISSTLLKSDADFIMHTDPGHGWLAVKRSHVPPNIQKEITGYSYQKGGTIYLEEDCDFSTFIRYLETQGVQEIKLYESYTPHSAIRNYQGFSPVETI